MFSMELVEGTGTPPRGRALRGRIEAGAGRRLEPGLLGGTYEDSLRAVKNLGSEISHKMLLLGSSANGSLEGW